jgi:hypothetical protein
MIKTLGAEKALQPGRVALLGFSQGSSVALPPRGPPPRTRPRPDLRCADIPPDVEEQIERLRGIAFMVLYGLKRPGHPQRKIDPCRARPAQSRLRCDRNRL